MIDAYVQKLIENLPLNDYNSKKPVRIDVVLDGGAFNGNYLAGALFFLKEMEKRGYIIVERISGCSIGSFVGLLYVINKLEYISDLNNLILNSFKTSYNFNKIKYILEKLKNEFPNDICNIVTNKLFISYNNVIKNKKCVKCIFKNTDEIIDAILKSSFIPFCIDGSVAYNGKYIDGITPYIFKKSANKKILYLDLLGSDKIFNIINVKNEKNNYNRLLTGLLDIHNFFIKKSNTSMCSFVDEWTIINNTHNNIKYIFEFFTINIIRFIIYLKKTFKIDTKQNLICKILSQIIFDVYSIILEDYCF